MNLLIVESPNKIKKIQSILGSGWVVAASFGHVRDLPLKDMGLGENYRPLYERTERANDTLTKLKSLANKSDIVYLATDPDREGEAIAWHLYEELKPSIKKYYRVAFAEITERAIKASLANPRQLDMDLVYAQEARRVLDRLVGYRVSPMISRKAGENLSAGRVQSVALRVIVETEESIKKFIPVTHYSVAVSFDTWKAELDVSDFIKPGEKYLMDKTLAESIAQLRNFTCVNLRDENKPKAPPAPFTTSTLQRAAQIQFGFAPVQTMKLAQELYEGGHITYMRTDSPNLSDDAFSEIKAYCSHNNIDCVDKKRTWHAKESAQEAHEAIRPTHFEEMSCGNNKDQQNLYKMIWVRSVASQMPDAVYANRVITLIASDQINDINVKFTVQGSTLIKAGWKSLTAEDQAEEDPQGQDANTLPFIQENTTLTATDGKVLEKKTTPPARFTQSGLIEFIEKKGIGRPATFASILDNIMRRAYIKEEKKGKRAVLVPTIKGENVIRLLKASKMAFLEYDYTSGVEEQLDEIAAGKQSYLSLVQSEDKVLDTALNTLGQQKDLWSCPKCGQGLARYPSKDRKNEFFWVCADRECKSYFADLEGKPALPSDKYFCEACGKPLILKNGQSGHFWACTGYPNCKQSYPDAKDQPDFRKQSSNKPLAAKCPACGSNVTESLKAYGCSNKECKFVLWKSNKLLQIFGKAELSPKEAEELVSGKTVMFKNLKSKGKTFDAAGRLEKDPTYGWTIKLDFDK